MKSTDVMKALKGLSSPTHRKVLPRHGVREPFFGVSYAELYKLQKKLMPDTALAKELWATGNHDARILATLIVEPSELTSRDLDAWIGAADNYVLNDAVSGVVARSKHAQAKSETWRKAKGEWRSAAGWSVVAHLASPDSASPDAWLAARLKEIEKGIHDAPNRTRHAMNQALIGIGGHRPELREAALSVAEAVGTVDVDHGQTSCKTPAAGPYIEKMAARAAKRKPARKSAAKPADTKRKATSRKALSRKTAAKKASKKSPKRKSR